MKHEWDVVRNAEKGTLEVICECGAHWNHPENTPVKVIQDTIKAHVAYFDKPKMETL